MPLDMVFVRMGGAVLAEIIRASHPCLACDVFFRTFFLVQQANLPAIWHQIQKDQQTQTQIRERQVSPNKVYLPSIVSDIFERNST